MPSWIYKGEEFNPDDVSKLYGFIYRLTFDIDGEQFNYIGKKIFNSITEIDALKNGNKRDGHLRFQNRNKNGKRIVREIIAKESNWRTYTSSSKDIGDKQLKPIEKEIIYIVNLEDGCKQTLSYMEDYYLFTEEVLFRDNNLNKNIAGRYFAGRIIGSKGYK